MIFGTGVKAVDDFILNAEPQYDDEDAGSTWRPIRHGDILKALHADALQRGWLGGLSRLNYSLSNDSKVMATSIMFGQYGFFGGDIQIQYGVGLINSNNRRRALVIYSGAVIRDNRGLPFGLIHNRLNETVRHTSGVDIPQIITESLDRFRQAKTAIHDFLSNSKDQNIWQESDRLMVWMARRRNMAWSAIQETDKLLRGTQYSAYDMLRALSITVQKNSALRQMDDLEAITSLLPEAPSPKIVEKKRA